MENTLKTLDETWSDMKFENEFHTRSGLKLLRTTEELIETLEDNQVNTMFSVCTCTCMSTMYTHVHTIIHVSFFRLRFNYKI